MAGFLVDENLPARLSVALAARGHEALHVSDIEVLRSATDDEVVAHASRAGLVLVTRDKEISFPTRFPEATLNGVVSVRLRETMLMDEQVRMVVAALSSLDPGDFAGNVVVVEPGRVRIRRGRRA